MTAYYGKLSGAGLPDTLVNTLTVEYQRARLGMVIPTTKAEGLIMKALGDAGLGIMQSPNSLTRLGVLQKQMDHEQNL